jgi:hypothetical protein
MGRKGDGGWSTDRVTAGSWLIRPFNSASDGCNRGVGVRFLLGAAVDREPSRSDTTSGPRGDEDGCRASNGSTVTLLEGDVTINFVDGRLPSNVSDVDPWGE